ncbi:nuclear transport factor 2 family protein [Roseisolibacter sp. H3M3-2]|uniref:nuclear transport factor 2 family protein n=1 Tax=Roseisolibacter sp. H3M3-2 TaxID=3031323 RepID=UPI0023DC9175|nr:nuclear transport factor 2 family protein [Roseisolibacter sp. H3M3-2]
MRALALAALLLPLPVVAPSLVAQAPERVSKSVAAGAPADAAGTLDAVVAAERAYAADAAARGMREASLAAFADDGVVFRDRVALAKPWWAATPPSPEAYRWAPATGAVAASGDLAYTSGPFLYSATPQDPAAPGHFASVWTRQGTGPWKVLVDVGVMGGTADLAAPFVPRALGAGGVGARGAASSAAVAEGQRAMLIVADRGLAAAVRADGPGKALAGVAADDVRALWPGGAVLGKAAVDSTLTARAAGASYDFQTAEARVSRAGDLGVTWGSYQARPGADGAGAAARGHYLRVWAREGFGWRLLLDALSPAGM